MEEPERGEESRKFTHSGGNPGNRKNRISEKIEEGLCIYWRCQRIQYKDNFCHEHHLDMLSFISANDARGFFHFCQKGRIDRQGLLIKYGLIKDVSDSPPDSS